MPAAQYSQVLDLQYSICITWLRIHPQPDTAAHQQCHHSALYSCQQMYTEARQDCLLLLPLPCRELQADTEVQGHNFYDEILFIKEVQHFFCISSNVSVEKKQSRINMIGFYCGGPRLGTQEARF